MHVRLTRIVGGSALRTDTIEGDAVYPPRVGYSFVMTAPALDTDYDGRFVTTSPVVEIHGEGAFTTQTGSRYKIDLLRWED